MLKATHGKLLDISKSLSVLLITYFQDMIVVQLQVRGRLTSLERKTIGALIVIDVHARDVVKELADSGLTDVTDFDWISQLRYVL